MSAAKKIHDGLDKMWSFGLWAECPDDVPVAWGARGITDRGCGFSLLGDRQTWAGPKALQKVMSKLINEGPLKRSIEEAKRLRDGFDPVKLNPTAFAEYWHQLKEEKPELFESFSHTSWRVTDPQPPNHQYDAPKNANPRVIQTLILAENARADAHWEEVQRMEREGEEIPVPDPPKECENEFEDYDLEEGEEPEEPCKTAFNKVRGKWQGCYLEGDAWVCEDCGYHHYFDEEEDPFPSPKSPVRDAYRDIIGQRGGQMRTDKAELFTLFDDGIIVIKGNTNGSCGYLYVIMYPNHVVIDESRVKHSDEHPGWDGDTNLADPNDIFWRGPMPIPQPGDKVDITDAGGIGKAMVIAHRVEHGYLHLITVPEGPLPDWWHEQNGERLFPPAKTWNVMGNEISMEVERAEPEPEEAKEEE